MRHAEWQLQTKIKQWCREAITCPHLFAAHDRSQNHSGLQHAFEKTRGLVAGWPDTELCLPEGRTIRVELKAPSSKPTERQNEIGAALCAIGHQWDWADSVTRYSEIIRSAGVSLRPNARLLAQHYDLILEAARSKPDTPRRASKPRLAKPTLAQIARTNAIRRRVLF